MEPLLDAENKGTNPLIFIGLAIAVAVVMVISTTTSFFRSGAYMTVKQIQIGTQSTISLNDESIDMLSPIKDSDIDVYASNISQRLKLLDDKADFGSEAVSDTSLKLN
jgi:hypothetical protein